MTSGTKVRYPRLRPVWGMHPGGATLRALVRIVVYGAIAWFAYQAALNPPEALAELGPEGETWTRRGGYVIAALMLPLIAWQILTLILAVPDITARRTVEGEVVARDAFRYGRGRLELAGRLWHLFRRRRDNVHTEPSLKHYVAVYTGQDERVLAWKVRPNIHSQTRKGARVRAVVTPRLGYVRSIEMLSPAPGGTDDPTSSLAGKIGTAAAGKVLRGMEGRLEELEGMRDEQGRPILDQTDEEGVTLRERVEVARRLSSKHSGKSDPSDE